MYNTFTASFAALGLFAGGFMGLTLIPDSPAHVVHLSVAELSYIEVDGKGAIAQRIASTGDIIVPADWRARIEVETPQGFTRILCEGVGKGNYRGERNVWALDDWTLDDCPDTVAPGAIFEVSWTYKDENGWPVTIGDRFVLGADGVLAQVE